MKNLMRVSVLAATLAFAGTFAFAQGGPGAGGPGGGGFPGAGGPGGGGFPGAGGPGGNFDPAQMQQMQAQMQERMLERYKTELKCTDDEWNALKPLVTKVQELQMKSGNGMMPGGRGGRGGRGGAQGGPNATAGGPAAATENADDAMSQLRKALADDATSADVIKEKVKAVRAERDKNTAALKTAREELRKVLTARQEAVLMMSGIMD
jgi:membrane-associated HD superfamily phosphohydrolase